MPFRGTVMLDGQPLADANVTFLPVSKGEFLASGKTDANGEYELKTVASDPVEGAVPGDYKVRISLVKTPNGEVYDPADKSAVWGRESLRPVYSDGMQTTLTATVPEEGGQKDFELKSK